MKTESDYEYLLTEADYEYLLNILSNAKPGKEARRLHEQLKKYGTGVPFMYRYPHLPLIISIIALVLVIIGVFHHGMH